MKSKRRIRIILDQRSAGDSPTLLENIANAFPSDDIFIKVNFNRESYEALETLEDTELESKIVEDVNNTLEQDSIILSSKHQRKEVNKRSKIKDYIEKIGFEGLKVSITSVIKGLIETWLK